MREAEDEDEEEAPREENCADALSISPPRENTETPKKKEGAPPKESMSFNI